MADNLPLLSLRNIRKNFANVTALDNVSFELHQGEVLALLGENGAGKSTLVNILCGVLQQDSGDISIEGKSVRFKSAQDAYNLGIAVIHQELNLAEELNVAENIFLGEKPKKAVLGLLNTVDYKQMHEQSTELLKMFECKVSSGDLISDLSPTERQLLEILKGIRRKCRIFLMDEPTAGLDDSEAKNLLSLVRQLKNQGVAIIYVSHILEEVEKIADRILVLRDGQKIGMVRAQDIEMHEIITMMVGREISAKPNKKIRRLGKEILKVENLSTVDGYVRGVSLSLNEGEILGLAGLTTSGRSELVRALYGLNKIHDGKIYLDGNAIHPKDARYAAELGFGMIPRDRKVEGVFGIRSVKENITIANLDEISGPLGNTRSKDEDNLANAIVKRLRISVPSLTSAAGFLSGGNQQKTLFGRWLAAKPKILLCDEPTRGIDVGAKAEIAEIIEDFAEEHISTISSSSELTELIDMCDRILVMFEGRIVREFSSETVKKDDLMRCVETGHEN